MPKQLQTNPSTMLERRYPTKIKLDGKDYPVNALENGNFSRVMRIFEALTFSTKRTYHLYQQYILPNNQFTF